MSQSGGLVWHLRALRYRRRLWAPFIRELDQWLAAWQPPERHLLILGSSAGWTLSPAFCARFERIVCVDLDPLALRLFRWLHAHRHTTLVRCDAMTELPTLLAAYPHHAVLCSNILGQIGFHCADQAIAENYITTLKHRLFGRSWASYHDCLSYRIAKGSVPAPSHHADRHQSLNSLAQDLSVQGECYDHLTHYALPDGPRLFMAWDILPTRRHWIEAGRIDPYGVIF